MHPVHSSYLLHVPLPDPKIDVQEIRKKSQGFSVGVVTWIKSLIWSNGPWCVQIKEQGEQSPGGQVVLAVCQ